VGEERGHSKLNLRAMQTEIQAKERM